jgi:WD40 repeat protein
MKLSMSLRLFATVVIFAVCFSFNFGEAQNRSVIVLDWSPSGMMIAGIEEDQLIVWDDETMNELLRFTPHTGYVTDVSWSPDSNYLATASPFDGLVKVWNAQTGTLVATLEGERTTEGPLFVDWNPNGRYIVSIASVIDGGTSVRLWQVEGELFELLPSNDTRFAAYDIAWSPNGEQLAIADFRAIYLINSFTDATLEYEAIAPFHLSILWSRNSLFIAATAAQSDIVIINVENRQVISNLPLGTTSLVGWDLDEQLLVVTDGQIREWNITDNTFADNSLGQALNALVFSLSPYTGRIASVDSDQITLSVQAFAERERFQAIAAACGAEQLVGESVTDAALPAVITDLQTMTNEQIPPACAADLLAIAEALQNDR